MWPKLTNENSFIFQHENAGGGNTYSSLRILKSTGQVAFNSLFSLYADISTTTTLKEEEWSHVAVSMENTSLEFVVDGTVESFTGTPFSSFVSGDLHIGHHATLASS